ncbi:MAG: undecaprenyl-diphosphate phosphatase [Muribaculaceae bacterium]|nr:undecaprenyl-diphosphate phosphatase [Muribaculaceae bacterium]MDE6835617.1 undecaprenyl-diphosphate phosphatase [Muribaculaceae bacterium]MDE6866126.1 undecaprenyl-diphosphate phosphatase [Muribaculaceae bacterium]
MDWLDALLLGIVQGLTEYLPVSSSGHLEIFRQILGVDLAGEEAIQFDVLLHAATVCSTLVILWPLFRRLCVSFFTFKRDADFWYVCKILLSCVPIAIVGFCFKDVVESFFEGNLKIVGICLLVTAFLLTFAHLSDLRAVRRLQNSNPGDGDKVVPASAGHDITWFDAFIIGCAQACAVLPGLSRSGTTIATGIILGDRRDQMAQFSFLMVIIPILGEALLGVKDMITEAPVAGTPEIGAGAMIIGFLASFIVGCCACKWMINLVKKGKLIWFAVYCVLAGLLCIFW